MQLPVSTHILLNTIGRKGRPGGVLVERPFAELDGDTKKLLHYLKDIPDVTEWSNSDGINKNIHSVDDKLKVECAINSLPGDHPNLCNVDDTWTSTDDDGSGIPDYTTYHRPFTPLRRNIDARLAGQTANTHRDRILQIQSALIEQFVVDFPRQFDPDRLNPDLLYNGEVYLMWYVPPKEVVEKLNPEDHVYACEMSTKIGKSNKPLFGQNSCRHKLKTIHTHRWESRYEYVVLGIPVGLDARDVEHFLHVKLGKYRLSSEWSEKDVRDYLPEFCDVSGCRIIERGFRDGMKNRIDNHVNSEPGNLYVIYTQLTEQECQMWDDVADDCLPGGEGETYARNKTRVKKIGVTQNDSKKFRNARGDKYLYANPWRKFEYYICLNVPNVYEVESSVKDYLEDNLYDVDGEWYAIENPTEIEKVIQLQTNDRTISLDGPNPLERIDEHNENDRIKLTDMRIWLERKWISYNKIDMGVRTGVYIVSTREGMYIDKVYYDEDAENKEDNEDNDDDL